VNKKNLSTDKNVVIDYFSDPLVFKSVTARYGNELLKSQELVNENITELSLPTILFHGEEDKIVPIESSIELSKLENVTYVPIPGSKHELLNQDTRPFVLSELHNWLNQNKLI
jgi:alpha-beta hydrolase superfamily lysophospholipase